MLKRGQSDGAQDDLLWVYDAGYTDVGADADADTNDDDDADTLLAACHAYKRKTDRLGF